MDLCSNGNWLAGVLHDRCVVELPFIDERVRSVTAPTLQAWEAVRIVVARSMDGLPAVVARAWGLEPPRAEGQRPLVSGSAVPGFRAVEAHAARSLRLEGRHRFSVYRLEFLVDEADSGAVVRARSYAAFPGPQGAVYRALVISSHGHVLAMHRMLGAIARHAERA